MRLHSRAVTLALAITRTVQQTIETSWSSASIGPDGPWQGVEVTVGIGQTLTVYPGTIFQSWLIPPDYCNFNRTLGCPAGNNGLYNSDKSLNSLTGSDGGIQFKPDPWVISRGLDVQGPQGTFWVDQMTIASGVNVPNVSIAITNKVGLAYPDGEWYPLSAGCLGLGAFGTVNQSFPFGGDEPLNASLIPGNLWENGHTASNSFGMHIGSAVSSASVSGSLQWGGYDKERVLGDVLTTDVSDGDNTVFFRARLTDISIEIIEGHSPFNFSEEENGLLSSSGGGVDVDLDGCSPYLTFSRTTCDNIAAHLPVTYNEDLGLYFWDTGSRQYHRIVSSASALAFSLESKSPGGDVESIKVRVPFAHLNLTLSSPLRNSATPYFPCFTGGREGADAFVLGRAFLQDAFLGANWGAQRWWLAQAPGPRVGNRNVKDIATRDVIISSGEQDWARSWQGSWVALEEDASDEDDSQGGGTERDGSERDENGGSPSQETEPPSPQPDDNGGLSTGAIAGIGAGAGLGALAVVGGLIFFCCRRKKKQRARDQQVPVQDVQQHAEPKYYVQHGHDAYAGNNYYRAAAIPAEPSEMYAGLEPRGGYQRHELA